MSETGINNFPGYCDNCNRISSVNLNDTVRRCKHCKSERIKLCGQDTRDPASIKPPTKEELVQNSRRLEEWYAQHRDEFRKSDEASIRGDVDIARSIVAELKSESADPEEIEIWREIAEYTEEDIRRLTSERDVATYWERHGYEDADDWVRLQLDVKPNWHDGKHICPECRSYTMVFELGPFFD